MIQLKNRDSFILFLYIYECIFGIFYIVLLFDWTNNQTFSVSSFTFVVLPYLSVFTSVNFIALFWIRTKIILSCRPNGILMTFSMTPHLQTKWGSAYSTDRNDSHTLTRDWNERQPPLWCGVLSLSSSRPLPWNKPRLHVVFVLVLSTWPHLWLTLMLCLLLPLILAQRQGRIRKWLVPTHSLDTIVALNYMKMLKHEGGRRTCNI